MLSRTTYPGIVVHLFCMTRWPIGAAETIVAGGERSYGTDAVLPEALPSYTIDLSAVECGYNAALYYVPMSSNPAEGTCNYYCDANAICGVACEEIDVMEANRHAFRSTLHVATDPDGTSLGVGSPYIEDSWPPGSYGPQSQCINTNFPFQLWLTFPENSVEVRIQQGDCSRSLRHENVAKELLEILQRPLRPVASLWTTPEGMQWLDGGVCSDTTTVLSGAMPDFRINPWRSPLMGLYGVSNASYIEFVPTHRDRLIGITNKFSTSLAVTISFLCLAGLVASVWRFRRSVSMRLIDALDAEAQPCDDSAKTLITRAPFHVSYRIRK